MSIVYDASAVRTATENGECMPLDTQRSLHSTMIDYFLHVSAAVADVAFTASVLPTTSSTVTGMRGAAHGRQPATANPFLYVYQVYN